MESSAKKVKIEQTEDEIKKCKHFVTRKKRFCKITVAKGKEYCGEHLPQESSAVDENDSNSNKRIPCPLDPKHTVYKKNLKKHLRICNARPKANPKYINPDINAGSSDEKDDAQQIVRLSTLKETVLDELIIKIESLYDKHIKSNIRELILEHEIMREVLNNKEYGKENRRHLVQTSSILGYLKHYHMLQDNTSFIEFGAGKGQVSFWLSQTINDRKNSRVILIDRASHRHKKDNKIEDRKNIHRIRADIADFDIRNLDLLDESTNVVAVSKHLCGAATDLALRCLLLQQQNNEKSPHIKSFVIALCCHHRCDWKSFVGKKFFYKNNLTQTDFAIMIKMVSWAICGTGYSRERRQEIEKAQKYNKCVEGETEKEEIEEDAEQGCRKLSRERKEEIGIICKRLLDYSRLQFMEDNNFECTLSRYVHSSITLENVCLVGVLRNKNT